MEEALNTLRARYVQAKLNDIRNGCVSTSERTFNLGQFVVEAEFRLQINDEITFWQDYKWVMQNYSI